MKKKNIIISITLIILAIIYTFLVKTVDDAAIGPNESIVGFSSINSFFHNLLGSNMTIYKITEVLGMIPLLMAGIYAIIGFIQLIKRKSLTKVDYEIYALAALYVVVLGLYVFFEKCIINYRPILIDGVLEASYPSSHTLMAICICGSSLIVNKRIFHKKIFNIENKLSIFLIPAIVLGRFISGVHWFSDILGGIIISVALLSSFYTIISSFSSKKETVKNNLEEDTLPIPLKDDIIPGI